mmetsp:Transcript_2684/g.6925  ORF Transcript_2684/g.6925 Transcript_2684/m.6925 type:complete len:366 (-) Transcript_2684:363-1460(-)
MPRSCPEALAVLPQAFSGTSLPNLLAPCDAALLLPAAVAFCAAPRVASLRTSAPPVASTLQPIPQQHGADVRVLPPARPLSASSVHVVCHVPAPPSRAPSLQECAGEHPPRHDEMLRKSGSVEVHAVGMGLEEAVVEVGATVAHPPPAPSALASRASMLSPAPAAREPSSDGAFEEQPPPSQLEDRSEVVSSVALGDEVPPQHCCYCWVLLQLHLPPPEFAVFEGAASASCTVARELASPWELPVVGEAQGKLGPQDLAFALLEKVVPRCFLSLAPGLVQHLVWWTSRAYASLAPAAPVATTGALGSPFQPALHFQQHSQCHQPRPNGANSAVARASARVVGSLQADEDVVLEEDVQMKLVHSWP